MRYRVKKKPTRAERCRDLQPWQHATGPKSAAGKTASSRNALQHGMRAAAVRHLLALLAAQNRYLTSVKNGL